MNTASLELCKELFKLSGWIGIYGPNTEVTYDLGYLIRQLPAVSGGVLTLQPADHEPTTAWRVGYGDNMTEADTPEDAACKLAIELCKQGVLK